jgi:mono/diheme cytochrome c family protein
MKSLVVFLSVVYLHLGSVLAADQSSEELFVRYIAPLLQEKCLACHGDDPEEIEGGLDLRQMASALLGGDSQVSVLVPGQPADSPLFLAAARGNDPWSDMPPKESERLSEQQVDLLRQWIESGAEWPDAERSQDIARRHAAAWSLEDGVQVATSGGLSEQWSARRYRPEGLWAYMPLAKPAVPADIAELASRNSGAGLHPVDAFIASRWPENLAVAPPADSVTLIRRLTFDLTGLPPSPTEIEHFVAAAKLSPEDAYQRLVDRLLDSPHYGERMAQHWLDVTRYADSSGFANDYERGNAWRFRDYVVRSFNADKPYDRFIFEQIAGDEIDPEDPEMLIATGFLRMGPWELTGMEVAKVARQRFLDDVTNSVGETFLAQSLQCCRCHDHKFDPIPTRDYYAIQAVFATTQLAERAAPFLPSENVKGFEEIKYLHALRGQYIETLQQLDTLLLKNAQLWFDEHQLSNDAWNTAVETIERERKTQTSDYASVFDGARRQMSQQQIAEDQYPPKYLGFTPQDYGVERVARKGLQRLTWELERYQPFALSVYNGKTPAVSSILTPQRIPSDRLTQGDLEETCILSGGDPFAPTEPVTPGVLSMLSAPIPPVIPTSIDGRRRALANWIADPQNPLTTRSIVNRIWLWHFGRPLAANPNNFGSTGKAPTHPDLLDWLAVTFVEQGWSFKQLHRVILTSEAYRRGTAHPNPTQLKELDPLGDSYAVFQPRRLTAEELRDAMLAVTGELNRQLGGIPNRPEINMEAALQPRQVMGTFAAAWVPNPLPGQRHRRSLYALKLRGLPNPQFEVFNQPTPDFSCERREVSNVTPQVFNLFNSHASHARALALADRALREAHDDEHAVRTCFLLALGRQPSAAALERCLEHWKELEHMLASESPVQHVFPLKVVRQAIEENTGQRFEFEEALFAYADFVPDLESFAVPVHTRGLADVCLILFNSNEFCYVY